MTLKKSGKKKYSEKYSKSTNKKVFKEIPFFHLFEFKILSGKVPRVRMSANVLETVQRLGALCEGMPKYSRHLEEWKKKCIAKELEYVDLYDMKEEELESVLGFTGSLGRRLLKEAALEARGKISRGEGHSCAKCGETYPFTERLQVHELYSKHKDFNKEASIKKEAVKEEEDYEETNATVVVDLAFAEEDKSEADSIACDESGLGKATSQEGGKEDEEERVASSHNGELLCYYSFV